MKRLAVIASFLMLAVQAHALSYTNIFGTSPNFLDGNPVVKSLPNNFVRIQAEMSDIEPAKGVFNFTTGTTCNDAMIAEAVAEGRTIEFDVWNWGAWVTNATEWPNRYQDLQGYVTNILNRWPAISILGDWNEHSWANTNNLMMIVTNAVPVSPNFLEAEYSILTSNIWLAKQSVNPAVKIDIGKFQSFDPPSFYYQCAQIEATNGIANLANYFTWHVQYDGGMYPALTNYWNGQSTNLSAANSIAAAQALFPTLGVGSDEWYPNDFTNAVQAATAYRVNGAAMLIDMLMPYPPSSGVFSNAYGCYSNGQLNATSLAIINALLPPGTNVTAMLLQGWLVKTNR